LEGMKLFERIIFFIASKAGCISHTIPGYTALLDKGIEYIITRAETLEKAAAGKGDSKAV
jgi:hypothetical protein